MCADKSETEECYICGFVCNPRRMVAHIKSHTEVEIFECEICGDRFASKKTLQKHYITHKTHFICEHCNKKFVDPVRLRSHICFNPEETYTCETCGKEFIHQSRFNKHVATHSEDKLKCTYCSKSFTHERNFKRHMSLHTMDEDGQVVEETSFSCGVCDEEFSTKQDFEKHFSSHSDESAHVCAVCNRGYKSRSDVVAHERNHHEQEPYQCSTCGKRFSRRSNLKVHYKMHLRKQFGLPTTYFNNGKIFTCDVCDKSFAYKKVLIQHQVTHTKEKPYTCQYCEQRFAFESCLKRHSYLHTEGAFRKRPKYPKVVRNNAISYVCQVCQSSFNEEIELQMHKKSFWQAQNYMCCKCYQVYRCKRKLKEHEKIHDIYSISSPVVCALRVENKDTGSESDTRDTEMGEESCSSKTGYAAEFGNKDTDSENEESNESPIVYCQDNDDVESESDSRDAEMEEDTSGSNDAQNYAKRILIS